MADERKKRILLEEGAEVIYDEEKGEVVEVRLASDASAEEILVKLREGELDERLPEKVRRSLEEKLEESLGNY
ncbi:transcriptional regulator, LysR family [Pyrolobus fumarii 1A]|uniref:Transcriptional regulator, LysR family n=1 Tax=Pyrolobus fumarii (strain DSM 11204 / 1A) TaxID=694429 RepID=G0EH53_PYRF1|nr:hypothetical protein [Pyrolobus fumarii]AEM39277.1 transcriptional regulator, LysR family [Pyrolobus fumarii 1A]